MMKRAYARCNKNKRFTNAPPPRYPYYIMNKQPGSTTATSDTLVPTPSRLTAGCSALLFAFMILYIFWDPFFSGKMLWSQDGAPIYTQTRPTPTQYYQGFWESDGLGFHNRGNLFRPTSLSIFFLEGRVHLHHIFEILLNNLLLYLAAIYFLKGRGIHGSASYIAALGLAFSGYAFTLISAGHRGILQMMPLIVFMLGSVDRAVSRNSLIHFAWAGALAALGIIAQPDITLLFILLAGIYGIFLLLLKHSGKAFFRSLPGYGKGIVVGALFFAAFSSTSFTWLNKTIIPQREASRGQSAKEKWIFSTNWSLPPEDVVEFIIPCIYGTEPNDSSAPYWGRLGQSYDWPWTGQGLRNFRQHTVYLGIVQVIFAFYALLWALRTPRSPPPPTPAPATKRKQKKSPAPGKPVISKAPDPRRAWRPHIFFWSSVAFVTTLLSFGRYFPLYRLFYELPVVSKIRCPVKFIHLTEVSLCMLAGFGLFLFLGGLGKKTATERPTLMRVLRGFPVILISLGATVLAMIPVVLFSRYTLIAHWERLGMAGSADVMRGNMIGALIHGSLVLLGAGVFIWFIAYRASASTARRMTPLALLTLIAIDLAVTNRKFIHVRDMRPWYRPNPIVDAIKTRPEPGRLSYLLSPSPSIFEWPYGNLYHHEIDVLQPRKSLGYMPKEDQTYFKTLSPNVFRFCQLTNTRYIMGSAQNFAPYLQFPQIEALFYFTMTPDKIIEQIDSGMGPFVLLELKNALPRAAVYHAWEAMEPGQALNLLASDTFDASTKLLVSPSAPDAPSIVEGTTTPVDITSYAPGRVELKTTLTEAGILLLNDKYDPGWNARVNGESAEILRCNYLMRGVHLPPGEHTILFTFRPHRISFMIWAGAGVLLLLWTGIQSLCNKRTES